MFPSVVSKSTKNSQGGTNAPPPSPLTSSLTSSQLASSLTSPLYSFLLAFLRLSTHICHHSSVTFMTQTVLSPPLSFHLSLLDSPVFNNPPFSLMITPVMFFYHSQPHLHSSHPPWLSYSVQLTSIPASILLFPCPPPLVSAVSVPMFCFLEIIACSEGIPALQIHEQSSCRNLTQNYSSFAFFQ